MLCNILSAAIFLLCPKQTKFEKKRLNERTLKAMVLINVAFHIFDIAKERKRDTTQIPNQQTPKKLLHSSNKKQTANRLLTIALVTSLNSFFFLSFFVCFLFVLDFDSRKNKTTKTKQNKTNIKNARNE